MFLSYLCSCCTNPTLSLSLEWSSGVAEESWWPVRTTVSAWRSVFALALNSSWKQMESWRWEHSKTNKDNLSLFILIVLEEQRPLKLGCFCRPSVFLTTCRAWRGVSDRMNGSRSVVLISSLGLPIMPSHGTLSDVGALPGFRSCYWWQPSNVKYTVSLHCLGLERCKIFNSRSDCSLFT